MSQYGSAGILIPYAAPFASQKSPKRFVPELFLLCKGDSVSQENNIFIYEQCMGLYEAPRDKVPPTSSQFSLPDMQAAKDVPCLVYNDLGADVYSALGSGLVGEIIFTMNSELRNQQEIWIPCNGEVVLIQDFPELYQFLGNKYGGIKNESFALPPAVECPFTVSNAKEGVTPKFYPFIRTQTEIIEPYLGMIAMVADHGEPPASGYWTPAKGQSVPQGGTQDWEYLFELYQWAYSGSDGITTNLPNLTAPKGYTYYIATGGQMASS